ncbi:antirestriction protein ArdA [Laspinema olomoucense]|uniref:antirestriction protein ArdA n=1 Tax=Laspinema olomoucense TaxID=3231600 RepID=UPI0021BB00BA|nr:antirestriction protein ArdA [Laspinema sp. D3c]MCT7992422.1 antirestriction protein ArdA [Laspinema sp. D3c]
MKNKNVLMVPETETAAEIAFALQSQCDGNAVILKTEDERAIELAVKLAGAEESCKIYGRCRIKPPPVTTPAIYVACLAAYNRGISHGWWIDAVQNSDGILSDIQEMLETSPVPDAQEWAIHDFDNFEFLRISEHESLETVSRWGQLLGENPNEEQAISHYIQYCREKEVEPNHEHFQESYIGFWDDLKDFAQSDYIAEVYDYPGFEKREEFWSKYVDWEYLGRELDLGGGFYIDETPNGIYVFHN